MAWLLTTHLTPFSSYLADCSEVPTRSSPSLVLCFPNLPSRALRSPWDSNPSTASTPTSCGALRPPTIPTKPPPTRSWCEMGRSWLSPLQPGLRRSADNELRTGTVSCAGRDPAIAASHKGQQLHPYGWTNPLKRHIRHFVPLALRGLLCVYINLFRPPVSSTQSALLVQM